MRSDSKVISWKSNPKLNKPFGLNTLFDTVENISIRPTSISILDHFLHFGLSVIERQTHRRAHKPTHGSSHDSNLKSFLISIVVSFKNLLHLSERSKHSQIQRHRSYNSWNTSSPKFSHSFILNNSLESIKEIFVVSLLFFWKGFVGLETY